MCRAVLYVAASEYSKKAHMTLGSTVSGVSLKTCHAMLPEVSFDSALADLHVINKRKNYHPLLCDDIDVVSCNQPWLVIRLVAVCSFRTGTPLTAGQ